MAAQSGLNGLSGNKSAPFQIIPPIYFDQCHRFFFLSENIFLSSAWKTKEYFVSLSPHGAFFFLFKLGNLKFMQKSRKLFLHELRGTVVKPQFSLLPAVQRLSLIVA